MADNVGDTINLAKSIREALAARGLNYDEDFIERFLLSLKTKPFVILTGISGTGKTALPSAIMSMIGNDQCKPIAVAPDWTDNTDMLGYFNVDEEFIIGEFTVVATEAAKNLEIPYFVILDEMNLARVEYYFAQVLSVMESRRFNSETKKVEYKDFLFNSAMRDRLKGVGKEYFANLRIPPNLYIVGTVNIDETTHPFSKKVLDRANVIETNEVDLMQGVLLTGAHSMTEESSLNLPAEEGPKNSASSLDETKGVASAHSDPEGSVKIGSSSTSSLTPAPSSVIDGGVASAKIVQSSQASPDAERLTGILTLNYSYKGDITNLAELQRQWRLNVEIDLVMEETLFLWISNLSRFNEVLKSSKMNFGFRVRDEVCIYLYYAAQNTRLRPRAHNWWHKYFDQQLVQKILTRFSGEQNQVEPHLVRLFNLCLTSEDYTQEQILEAEVRSDANIIFRSAATKLRLMLRDVVVEDKPSTSFWMV